MVSFSKFTFCFQGFHLKKWDQIQLIFEQARGGNFSGEQ